jgi:hypothetical protein
MKSVSRDGDLDQLLDQLSDDSTSFNELPTRIKVARKKVATTKKYCRYCAYILNKYIKYNV